MISMFEKIENIRQNKLLGKLFLKVIVAQSCLTLCDPMEFSRPEYWSGQPFPSPGNHPNPGIESRSSALHADSLPAEPQGNCWNLNSNLYDSIEEGIFVSYCCSNKLPQI